MFITAKIDYTSFIMTKYREYIQRMFESNQEAFDRFRRIHDEYCLAVDKESLQDKYNEEGAKITEIIEEWEQRLCSQSEKAGYGSYSGSLAEKFHEEIKKVFPMIDYIGLIVEKFEIKKMKLHGLTPMVSSPPSVERNPSEVPPRRDEGG